jgi:hypothetical protein
MERLFKTVKISDRLPNMGQRVMFLDVNYDGEIMHNYNPSERVEIKKDKFIQLMECHYITDYLKKNYTHWLEEILEGK